MRQQDRAGFEYADHHAHVSRDALFEYRVADHRRFLAGGVGDAADDAYGEVPRLVIEILVAGEARVAELRLAR